MIIVNSVDPLPSSLQYKADGTSPSLAMQPIPIIKVHELQKHQRVGSDIPASKRNISIEDSLVIILFIVHTPQNEMLSLSLSPSLSLSLTLSLSSLPPFSCNIFCISTYTPQTSAAYFVTIMTPEYLCCWVFGWAARIHCGFYDSGSIWVTGATIKLSPNIRVLRDAER